MKSSILMISPFFSPGTGGVETFLDDLIKYLNNKNKGVDVISYQPLATNVSAPFFQRNGDNEVYRIYWPKFNLFYKLEKYPILQLLYLASGIGLFTAGYFLLRKTRNYKTVHCHGMAAGFIGFVLSYFTKRNFVLNFHTNYRFSKKEIVGRFIVFMTKRFNSILVLSNACKKNLIDIGVNENKIRVYYNWIDADIFNIHDKYEARRKLGLNEDNFYALFVGRFSKEKGIFDLLDAIPQINKNISILIIGSGVDEYKVVEAANKNQNVRYLGRKNSNELALYFNAADVLVYAPVDEDYLGRVAISALNCGLPIMIPRQSFYGGIKTEISLIIPEKVGVVFENNHWSFAEKLNNLFDIGAGDFDRECCKRYAQEFYGEEKNGEIIAKILLA